MLQITKNLFRHFLLGAALIVIVIAAQTAHGKATTKGKGKATEPVVAAAPEEEAIDESLNASLVVNAPESAALAIETSGAAEASATDAATMGAATPEAIQEAIAKAEINKLPESQIPVLANAKNSKKVEAGAASRIYITLGVLTVLLGAALFFLKRWNSRKGMDRKHTQIKILTQHVIGPKKSLAIVQVAGESILIGITDQNISMLKSLSLIDDEIPETTPKNFNSALDSFDDEYSDEPVRGRGASARDRDGGDENFSIRGLGEIRDVVSKRIKGMKNL